LLTATAGRDGQKSVQAEFMDSAGWVSAVAKDTILLDRTAPVGRVEIDGGASGTVIPVVTVKFVARGAVQMQMRLDGDADWPQWEPFVRSKAVTLTSGTGTKTVEARFADEAGNVSDVASDTIAFQAGPIPLADAVTMMRPRPVWQHFYELTQVPRPSHHEEGATALVRDFGRRLGLETIVDRVGNVIVRKPATAGRGKLPGVVLQAHLDMVAQRTPDSPTDPRTDPIRAFVQDGWVRADRTTLGADDGIGVAMIMALLEADDFPHGPLEALFTVDEEDGFDGIKALSADALKGRLYINVDNEQEGQFLISSAGGVYVNVTDTYAEVATPTGSAGFTVTVDGLLGGHSGADIDKGRGSAHQLMSRLLVEAPASLDVRVAGVHGGDLSNAIPRTTVAVVALPAGQSAPFQTYVAEFAVKVAAELAATDPGVTVTAQPAGLPPKVMEAVDQRALIGAVYAAPQGIYRMSSTVPGLVETSGNLGVLEIADGHFSATAYVRSAIDSERDAEAQRFAQVFQKAGAAATIDGAYSSWPPDPSSPLLALMTQVYSEMLGTSPLAAAIHAGLETSVAGVTFPGMDMISVGPTIRDVHSPDERLEVASVPTVFDLIVSTLRNVGHLER
jgi:dipeptidase D